MTTDFRTSTKMFPLTTTLNRIKAWRPCTEGWAEGLKAAGKSEPDDEPISYETILDAVGLQHALWCCRAEPQHAPLWRRYAVWCARQVQYLMTDQRSIAALDVAERYANGFATGKELAAASAAASDASAASAASAARAAASAASAAEALAASAAQSGAFRQLVTTGTLPQQEVK